MFWFELGDVVGSDSGNVGSGDEYELGFEFDDVAIECYVGFDCEVNLGFDDTCNFGVNIGVDADVGVVCLFLVLTLLLRLVLSLLLLWMLNTKLVLKLQCFNSCFT